MAEFYKGNHLNSKLDEILEKAESSLILVSPFIKFHSRVKEILNTKKKKHELLITVVFGKNEDRIEKSFSREDFEYISEFPNVEIMYEPRLHAKYYANESASLLSSMNLYEFSQNNNIEFGIYCEKGFVDNLLNIPSLDREAWNYFKGVIDDSEVLYRREPVYEDGFLGFTQKYVNSEIEIDKLSEKFGLRKKESPKKEPSKKAEEYRSEKTNPTIKGFCIRTREEIPFNIAMPFSERAFKSWSRYEDKDYKERYCHFSGEESDGETSFSKPILKKNWQKAKKHTN